MPWNSVDGCRGHSETALKVSPIRGRFLISALAGATSCSRWRQPPELANKRMESPERATSASIDAALSGLRHPVDVNRRLTPPATRFRPDLGWEDKSMFPNSHSSFLLHGTGFSHALRRLRSLRVTVFAFQIRVAATRSSFVLPPPSWRGSDTIALRFRRQSVIRDEMARLSN